MQALQTLRQARFLARLVLVWFAFSLGVAVASPLVKPIEIDVICTGTGAGPGAMKLMIKGDAGQKSAGHTLDCPLCAGTAAPPPVAIDDLSFVAPLGHALRPIAAAHIAARLFAPLPARGPPAFLVL